VSETPKGFDEAAAYGVPINSLVWLGPALLLEVGVVLAGLGPKEGKPVGRTRLIRVAGVVLIAGIILCGALGVFSAPRL